MKFDALAGVLLIPAVAAALLASLPGYRLSARLNVLAATGAKGMPLVVEFSVAFSILIAFIVFGVFVFRIRERFDTVDVAALDRFRGERSELQ